MGVRVRTDASTTPDAVEACRVAMTSPAGTEEKSSHSHCQKMSFRHRVVIWSARFGRSSESHAVRGASMRCLLEGAVQ